MMILEKREVWQELFSLLSQYSLFWSPQQIQASSSESGFNPFSAMGGKPVPYSTILDHWSVCLKYHFCLWAVRKGVDCSLISRYFPFSIAQLRRRQWHPTPVLFCMENSVDGGAWQASVHGVAKSLTRLSDFTFTFHYRALEKEMATHSSVLAWRIPAMGEPGGLPSMGSHRVRHDWSDLAAVAKQLSS